MPKRSAITKYYEALIESPAPLPATWQRRIVEHATDAKRHDLIAGIAARDDVDAELLAELGKHTAAQVRVAWLLRHADDIDLFVAHVSNERRKTVLATLAPHPDLPDDAFDLIVARADGVELVVTLLETGRVPAANAGELIARVADGNPLIQEPIKARVAALEDRYPDIWTAVLENTSDINIARDYMEKLEQVDDDLFARVLKTHVEPLCQPDAAGYYELGALSQFMYMVSRHSGISAASLRSAGELLTQILGDPNCGRGNSSAVKDLQRFSHSWSQHLPEVLEQLQVDPTPESGAEALIKLRSWAYSDNENHMNSVTAAEILRALIGNDVFGDRVRASAVKCSSVHGPGSVRQLLAHRADVGFTLTPQMVCEAQARTAGPEFVELIEACTDPRAALTQLVSSNHTSTVCLLDHLGLLDDELLTTAARTVTGGSLMSEYSWVDKAVQARVMARVTELVEAELGDTASVWDLFEMCFEEYGDPIVDTARIAATAV